MWTVEVRLADGSTEVFADENRHEHLTNRSVWAFSYEVDTTSEALRVFRRTLRDYGDGWEEVAAPHEVAYLRSDEWKTVRGD